MRDGVKIHIRKIFHTRDLCLRALDTNPACAKSVRRNEDYMYIQKFQDITKEDIVTAGGIFI